MPTGKDGGFKFKTIMPGLYGKRAPHIHIKIYGADGYKNLTTELLFPGHKRNYTDRVLSGHTADQIKSLTSERVEHKNGIGYGIPLFKHNIVLLPL